MPKSGSSYLVHKDFQAVTHYLTTDPIFALYLSATLLLLFPVHEQVTFSMCTTRGEISARGTQTTHTYHVLYMTRLAVFVHKHLAESSCTLAACAPPSHSLGVVFMCTARTFSASQYNRMGAKRTRWTLARVVCLCPCEERHHQASQNLCAIVYTHICIKCSNGSADKVCRSAQIYLI